MKTTSELRALLGTVAGVSLSIAVGIMPVNAVELKFWTAQSEAPAIIEAFEAANPDIDVTVTVMQSEDYKTQLRVAVAGGDIPDVYTSNEGFTFFEYVDRGAALDITEIIDEQGWRDDIFPDFLKADTDANGRIWGVPWSTIHYWQAIFYNKDFFEENGIAVPSSVDELVATAAEVQSKGKFPVAFGDVAGWPAILLLGDLMLQQVGPDHVGEINSGAVKWTESEAARKAFQTIGDMGTKGVFAPGFLTVDHEAAIQAWFSGRAAMLYNGTWWPANTGGTDSGFAIGVMPLPKINAEQPLQGSQFWASTHLLISSQIEDEKKDAAIKLVDFLLSLEGMQIFGSAAGAVTSNPEANKTLDVADFFHEPAFTAQADLPKMGYYDHAFPIPVIEVIKTELQKLMQGATTVDAALAAVEAVHAQHR